MFDINYLFSKNSFLSGMSRVLDLRATQNQKSYNLSNSINQSDYKSLQNDWDVVGRDMMEAVGDFRTLYTNSSKNK